MEPPECVPHNFKLLLGQGVGVVTAVRVERKFICCVAFAGLIEFSKALTAWQAAHILPKQSLFHENNLLCEAQVGSACGIT